MTRTHLETDLVRGSAANLGRIMDDMSAFTALREQLPSLGNFDLAQQLQAIADDRRTGVIAHADQLKESLGDMSAALTTIATDLASIDSDTAARIRALVAELTVRVNDDLAALGVRSY
jgi:hypothetical protein